MEIWTLSGWGLVTLVGKNETCLQIDSKLLVNLSTELVWPVRKNDSCDTLITCD